VTIKTIDVAKQIKELNNDNISLDELQKFKSLLREYIDLFVTNPKKPTITLKTKHFIAIYGYSHQIPPE
jgi:hypothetical protein